MDKKKKAFLNICLCVHAGLEWHEVSNFWLNYPFKYKAIQFQKSNPRSKPKCLLNELILQPTILKMLSVLKHVKTFKYWTFK